MTMSTYTKGCSTLKRVEVVWCEKGMFESNIGEEPADDPCSRCRSVSFVPF